VLPDVSGETPDTVGPDGDVTLDDSHADKPGEPDLDDVTVEPDEVEPPDVVPEVEVPEDEVIVPLEYPFETYGPMTISMKGIIIGGKYEFLRFAEASYWKIPYEQWDYVLDMIRDAGFSGVYTSTCWRLHEPVKGQFDLTTGSLAVGQFMEKAKSRGLYIYFHAGPWIDGEAGGCLPDWVLSGGDTTPSPVADGKMAIRLTDADYQGAVNAFLDQLNPILAPYQTTIAPDGRLAFYQIESNYDLFYFLKEAASRINQEMLGIAPAPLNPGLYFSQLRDSVKADGITVPLVTSLTGDFENGGRIVIGTGDTPGIYPAFDLGADSPYESMEVKIWNLRLEMRKEALHGKVYLAVPGIAVGLMPSAPHMARALMAGADIVVVKDFAASLLPLALAPVSVDAHGIDLFSKLNKAKVAMGTTVRDYASPLALSGLPRRSYYAFKGLNQFLNRFGSGFAGKDWPYRTGPNKHSAPYPVKVVCPAAGAIEQHYDVPAPGAASGVLELMADHFKEWFQVPVEPVGRGTYFFDSMDGSVIVHLLNLDDLKDGKNKHKRQDLIGKVEINGQSLPRHSSVVIPATDDVASGEPSLGWGGKFMVLNHPLGPGYPLMEYSSTNLWTIREFNGKLLIIAHGKPTVKSGGLFFTEAGEISFGQFGGIPDIIHNTLPGGAVHTDAGGKIAAQFQHDSTGFLVMTVPSGKQVMLMVTTTEVAQTAYFAKDELGMDIALFGMDRVESMVYEEGKLVIAGKVSPGMPSFHALTATKPFKIQMAGQSVTCTFDEVPGALECPLVEGAWPAVEAEIPHSAIYVRDELYMGSPSDLGVTDFPDQFATAGAAPLPLQDPTVAASQGIAWYVTQVDLPVPPPNQEGFFSVTGGTAHLASLYVNGTYIGSSAPMGNLPMKATDVISGLPAVGYRIPAGLLLQGSNTLAIRVVALGSSPASMPMVYAAAPLLPPDLDPLASTIPHLAIQGLAATSPKGIWGAAKVTVGAVSQPLNGAWTISKGDASGMARPKGMLQGWHALPPAANAPEGQGFTSVPAVSEEAPVYLVDGQTTWMTTSFASKDLTHEGNLALELSGRSVFALVFLNGKLVAPWASDPEAFSQGLNSQLLQAAGTRQVLADLGYAHYYSNSEGRIPLPRYLLSSAGGQDNRVTCLFLDFSPALDSDLVLPGVGTVAGKGTVTSFSLRWNREAQKAAGPVEENTLVWNPLDVEFLPPPNPEE
jgi:hypothetical protein